MEKVIASSGQHKSEYINKPIDSHIARLIGMRKTQIISTAEESVLFFHDSGTKCFVISPILEGGDVYGSIIIHSEGLNLGEVEKSIASTFADFISKQIG